jgi:hypothetical protein
MKTAEQLAHEYWERPQWQLSFMPFIEEVQLEAFKAGMEHAAIISFSSQGEFTRDKAVECAIIHDKIRNAAQQLTQLP